MEIHYMILENLEDNPAYLSYSSTCKFTYDIISTWDPWGRLLRKIYPRNVASNSETVIDDPVKSVLPRFGLKEESTIPIKKFGKLWLREEQRSRGKCIVRGAKVNFGTISAMQVGDF